jgi:NAD(P)-dependent dehydrogenase (short-subunit alcohol dehydrogenase family)
MRLKDRVLLVTGGGRAIGRRIALCAAREGADVGLLGPAPDERMAVATEVRTMGRRANAVVADVSDEAQVQAAIRQVREELGPIDVLVNNAAIVAPTAPIHEVTRDDWDRVLAVNLTGAFLCSRAVLPEMMARRSGKIINIASVAGKLAYPLRAPYSVSKRGLIGLTLTLAKEAGAFNVQVNAVCPGPVTGERMRTIIENRGAHLGRPIAELEAVPPRQPLGADGPRGRRCGAGHIPGLGRRRQHHRPSH